jgi:Zn-dependent protease
MFWPRLRLFRLSGHSLELDASWPFVLALAVGSLAQRWATDLPHLSPTARWSLAATAAALLAGSVLLHELAHAWVARVYEIPVARIVLYVFGGVTELRSEPATVRSEFFAAVAGPLTSLLLGLAFVGGWFAGIALVWPGWLVALFAPLAVVNIALGALNLLPAYPLDGGRVLRAFLWPFGDFSWATRVSAALGSAVGVGLVVLGVVAFAGGRFVSGVWIALAGWFLHDAARASSPGRVLRRALGLKTVGECMDRDVVGIAPWLRIEEAAEGRMRDRRQVAYPVVEGERVLGSLTLARMLDVPRREWASCTAAEIMEPCTPDSTTRPEADALAELARMSRSGSSHLLVLDGERLVGVLAAERLVDLVARRLVNAPAPRAAPPAVEASPPAPPPAVETPDEPDGRTSDALVQPAIDQRSN